jgi:hypothetical protein
MLVLLIQDDPVTAAPFLMLNSGMGQSPKGEA